MSDEINKTLRDLRKLDFALSEAQGAAGNLVTVNNPHVAAKSLGDEIWTTLEDFRRKVNRMIVRRERSGGVF
jgi:hypothetical protein